jgi:hypothetical protein
VIIAFFSRYSSLASLVAAVFAPLYYLFGDREAWYVDKILLVMFAISALLVYRHRENINKLLKGTESKLGGSKHAQIEPHGGAAAAGSKRLSSTIRFVVAFHLEARQEAVAQQQKRAWAAG